MLKRKGNGKNEGQEKKTNTEPLSPKKDKEPELPAAVIPDLVCG